MEQYMKEAIKQRMRRCPVCKKEYPEDDNYCGDDGSVLEQARAPGGRDHQPGESMTGSDVNAKTNDVL
jgi:hypothetical protein